MAAVRKDSVVQVYFVVDTGLELDIGFAADTGFELDIGFAADIDFELAEVPKQVSRILCRKLSHLEFVLRIFYKT